MWSDFLSLVWKSSFSCMKNEFSHKRIIPWQYHFHDRFCRGLDSNFVLPENKNWQGEFMSQKTRPTRYKNSLLLSISNWNWIFQYEKHRREHEKTTWATSTAMFELLRTRGLKFCWIFHGNCRYTEASTHFAELWWRWHPYWLQFRSTWDALGIYLLIRSNCKKLIPVYI